jgi:hypothetical protein
MYLQIRKRVMSMRKFGNFQILGAAITTIGVMFLVMNGLAYFNVIPMAGAGFGTAIVSLLMATNGYMIMLYGMFSNNVAAAAARSILN